MKVLTVVGARPQFVKAAMLSSEIKRREESGVEISEFCIHTGQHYDPGMSEVFFDEMGIPDPLVNLHVGSGSHAITTAKMLSGIEEVMLEIQPDWVVLYGDTNSTLAGALAASKLNLKIAHIEAGLRSFNRAMPEEVNRVVTDHLSDLLFCPTQVAVNHLNAEGITNGVHHVGDIMYDAAMFFGRRVGETSEITKSLNLSDGEYFLASVHRAENVDSASRLRSILEGLGDLSKVAPVVLPLHPRTEKFVGVHGLDSLLAKLVIIPPVSFLEMIALERSARCILTDSGGVQKEAYFHRVPCCTLRDETEWVETVESGWNLLVGSDRARIQAAATRKRPDTVIEDYGSGNSARIIIDQLLSGE